MIKKQAICCALLMSLSFPALANEPYNLRGTWEFEFIGIPFAKLWVALEEKPEDYKLTAAFKSKGILRVFKSMRSLSQSEGVRGTDGQMQALWFQYDNEDDGKHKRLEYDASGALTGRDIVPEDDPWHRPPVDAKEVLDAASPGDVIFELRDLVSKLDKSAGSALTLKLYEGERLAEITVTYVESPTITLHGEHVATHQLHLSRTLLGGYTDKEIRRYREGDPPVFLYVRQSDSFPVAMQAKLPYGSLQAIWKKD